MFFPPIIMSLSGFVRGLVPNRKVARPRLVISYTTYKMKVNCSRGWEFIWSLGSGWRRGLWTFEINIFSFNIYNKGCYKRERKEDFHLFL